MPGRARRLKDLAERVPARAESVRQLAVRLRELLFRMFSSVVAQKPLSRGDLLRLDRWVARAHGHRHLVAQRGAPTWAWDPEDRLDQMLWPVALGAGELLTDEARRLRVRMCEGWDCGWLFLDFSRRANRRWCDMSSCGNRAKARRHYARKRLE